MSIDSPADLEGLRRVGRVVAETIAAVRDAAAVGVTTAALDRVASEVFASHGARSAPQLDYDFPGVICLSVNDECVHGIPGERELEDGDLLKIDVTAELDGFVADAAVTVEVGDVDSAGRRLRVGAEAALTRALRHVRAGMPASAVGAIVEDEVESRGLTVLRELAGHGVGRAVHEEPTIPNWPDPDAVDVLTAGLVITIEPIIASGTRRVFEEEDGWTIRTMNGSRSAHFEHTIVVTEGEPIVLTAAA
jgi:methionyl aminopeptidase